VLVCVFLCQIIIFQDSGWIIAEFGVNAIERVAVERLGPVA
jgi:type IV secretory pathway TrbD component